MRLNDLFKVTAIAGALTLAACGGDINITTSVPNGFTSGFSVSNDSGSAITIDDSGSHFLVFYANLYFFK